MAALTENQRRLRNCTRKSRRARQKADEAWEEQKALICEIYESGDMSLQAIADVTGVTKARVWQIVRNYYGVKRATNE